MLRYLLPLMILMQPVLAADLQGPALAAASNFGQGWRADIYRGAKTLGVLDFRDAVYWNKVLDDQGRHVFTAPTTRYPSALPALSLTVNNGHPAFDDGHTPTSAAAVAAFGRHAAEMVARFPSVHSIEVGNEFNSANFVSGPLRSKGLQARARAYAALLRSVHTQVKATRPEVRVLGGALHSIPTGYLGLLLDNGVAAHMDALALHPYDTRPELLADEVAALRRLPQLETIPLEVTEFGTPDAQAAPGFLLRSHCRMGLAGVARAAWYPLHPRGDGFAALLDDSGHPTPTGQVFAFAQAHLAGRKLTAFDPDPFTFGCLYGADTLVVWGAPRALTLGDTSLSVLAPDGHPIPIPPRGLRLSPATPLIIRSTGALDPGADLAFGPQTLVADSLVQYRLRPETGDDPFDRFARRGGRRIALTEQPGQARPGTPWSPYRGAVDETSARIGADFLLPAGGGDNAVEIVHRFAAQQAATLDIQAHWQTPPRSVDGIGVSILLNGDKLHQVQGKGRLSATLRGLSLAPGDHLDFVVNPRGDAQGDITDFRIRLFRSDLRP